MRFFLPLKIHATEEVIGLGGGGIQFRDFVQCCNGSVGVACLEQLRRPLDRALARVGGRRSVDREDHKKPEADSDHDKEVSSCECLQQSAPGKTAR